MAKQSSSNVERGAEILLALGEAGVIGMSLSEIAAAIDEPKSAVHRALTGYARYGFVEQSGRRGNYRLGPAVYALARRMPRLSDQVAMFRPALLEIAAATGISCYLMARSGMDAICLDFQLGLEPVQPLLNGSGQRLPVGAGQAGVCMLARMPEDMRERTLELNGPLYARLGVSEAVIREEMAMFLERGHVIGIRLVGGYRIWTLSFAPAPEEHRFGDTAVSLVTLDGNLDAAAQQRCIDVMHDHLPYKWRGRRGEGENAG